MLKLISSALIAFTGSAGLAVLLAATIDRPVTEARASENRLSSNKAYTFAGVVADRSRRVKRNKTTAEVKVTDQLPEGKNAGKTYDVIFLVRPGAVSAGKILTLTSAPVEECRGFLKTFLTETLSPKRINKAYKNTRLATVGKDAAAESLAESLDRNGWLKNCTTEATGDVDVFQVLIVNDHDR